MKDPAVLSIRKRVALKTNHELIPYHSIVQVTMRNGSKFTEQVTKVRGRPDFPMTTEMVEEKSKPLLEPVIGRDRTERLIDTVRNLEKVIDMCELRPLISA